MRHGPALCRARPARARRVQRVLSAGLMHDEVQPAHRRGAGAAAGLCGRASVAARAHGAGVRGSAPGGRGGAVRGHGHGRDDVPARGGRARRVHGPAADPGVPPRPRRRGAHEDPGAGLRARHEPRQRGDGRLCGRERALRPGWLRRPAGAARGGRTGYGRPDADQPQHRRPVRRQHPGDHAHRARGGRPVLLRRREPQCT